MSTNNIDEMTESEAKDLLNSICNIFGIGGKSRGHGVILVNVENANRRSDCLSKIESFHTAQILDEDEQPSVEELLNWGESPDKYLETYKALFDDLVSTPCRDAVN